MDADRLQRELASLRRLPPASAARRLAKLVELERLSAGLAPCPADPPLEEDGAWTDAVLGACDAGAAPAHLDAATAARAGFAPGRSVLEVWGAAVALAADAKAVAARAAADTVAADASRAARSDELAAAALVDATLRGTRPGLDVVGAANPALVALAALARGRGGGALIVTPDACPGPSVFRAGTRLAPVGTLLEAAARVVLAPGARYDVVGLMTYGEGADETLPAWSFGGHDLRAHPLAVWLRPPSVDELDAPPAPPLHDEPLGFGDIEASLNASHTLAASGRIAAEFHLQDLDYYAVLAQLVGFRDHLVSLGRRAALLVDARVILPDARRRVADGQPSGPVRDTLQRLVLGPEFAASAVDLVVFGDPESALLATNPAAASRARIARGLVGATAEQVASLAVPPIRLADPAGPRIATAAWPTTAPDTFAGGLVAAPGVTTAFDALTRGRFVAPLILARRPKDPAAVDLEFWAEIDLEPLRRALEREVVGQAAMKAAVIEAFERVRRECRDALRAGHGSSIGRFVVLPRIALFGQSGMGKTLVAEIVGRELLGPGYFDKVTCAAGLLAVIGGAGAPWIGADKPTALMRFAERLGGTGVFFFDELTRAMRASGESLSRTLDPLYELLGSARFRPAFPVFSDVLPTGHVELANVTFFVAGNVVKNDVPLPGPEYAHARDLGAAVLQRLSRVVYVDPLDTRDLPRATRQMMERRLRLMAPSPGPIVSVDDGVVAALAAELAVKFTGEPASLRAVEEHLGQRVDFGGAVAAWHERPTDRLHLGPGALAPRAS